MSIRLPRILNNMRTLSRLAMFVLICGLAAASAQTDPGTATQKPAANKPDAKAEAARPGKISPEQAADLFKSVDAVMRFASTDTSLPIQGEVKKSLADRDAVVRYVEQKMAEDEDQQRFERAELVLKRFGLLPPDFHLKTYMLALLREQVAGYYDSKTKTMNLLDWLPPEEQQPIMAHELTHALQDQTADLEGWHDRTKAAAHHHLNNDDSEVEIDEASSAWSAVLEGQGMAVMFDFMLAGTKRSIFDSPRAIEMVKQSMNAEDATPVLKNAPLILREALIFPYRDGLGFVAEVAREKGRAAAFSGLLKDPPRDTREVLEPAAYLKRTAASTLTLPDLQQVLGKDKVWRYDVGSFGEFDIGITLRQFGEAAEAKSVASGWRAGGYYSVAPAGKKEAELQPADLHTLLVTRWANAEAAEKFAAAYRAILDKRYPAAKKTSETWQTAEGPASVEVAGDAVVVLEGFDSKEAGRVRASALKALQGTGVPVKRSDLGLRLAAPVAAFFHPSWPRALKEAVQPTP